jgi:hypothetical protein
VGHCALVVQAALHCPPAQMGAPLEHCALVVQGLPALPLPPSPAPAPDVGSQTCFVHV